MSNQFILAVTEENYTCMGKPYLWTRYVSSFRLPARTIRLSSKREQSLKFADEAAAIKVAELVEMENYRVEPYLGAED